jgi:hypothetical protein
VFEVFDEWRRAVGVPIRDGEVTDDESQDEGSSRRHGSLPAHLERVIARLTTLRGGEDRSLDDVVDRFVRELDASRAAAKGLRGDARAAFLERLRTLDDELMAAARGLCTAPVLQQLEGEADEELAPFRARMPREAFEQSRRAAVDRLLRERRRLPVVTFD